MDDEERRKKLEAGKAKLANFRKKRSSKKKKKNDTPVSTPRDASRSEEVGAGDSIAVQTGDDSSARVLSPFDDTDHSSTTADEISTEEELGYSLSLTAVERIQELELTVSDQQVALQKLTLENKELRDKNEAASLGQSIEERESVFKDLKDSVSRTAQHVRQIQQRLVETTDAVLDTGGEQGQVVAELTATRQKLDTYEMAILRQEEALKQMAHNFEVKSAEADEANQKCRSLQSELEKTHSHLATSEENLSGVMQSLKAELEQEKQLLRAHLEEEHGKQIAFLKQEHYSVLEEEKRKIREMAQRSEASVSPYDPEDARAYREQIAMMRSQLETAFRDIDKLKKDHDKEVVQLNQTLVNSIDEYETKLQEERMACEDIEQRLEMSDTVSSEIQASFSKQLEQLEEDRDALRQQLKQAQLRVKENSTSQKQIKDLEDEVLSYQTELAETSRRLENAEKQARQFRDEIERCQENITIITKDKDLAQGNCDTLNKSLTERTRACDELAEKVKEHETNVLNLQAEHTREMDNVEKMKEELGDSFEKEKANLEDRIKCMKSEHAEELKNLHSQHYRQIDELKHEMEKQLESSVETLEEERKEQLETVKDVHERTRDRELARLREEHQELAEKLQQEHREETASIKEEAQEIKQLAEERLRIELKQEFDTMLESELSNLRRSLEQENDLALIENEDRRQEELLKLKDENEKHFLTRIDTELEEQQAVHLQALLDQQSKLDKALEAKRGEFENAQEVMAKEHAESLNKLKTEIEEIRKAEATHSSQVNEVNKVMEAKLKEALESNDELKEEVDKLQKRLDDNIQELEQDYRVQLEARGTALLEEKERNERELEENEKEMESLKEELLVVQRDRDQILQQAEESQKRLASLHHEESIRLQDEIDQLESLHRERMESMQLEIDALRDSNNDLQDLHKQLLADYVSGEDVEQLRSDFAKEKEQLMMEHEEDSQKIRLEHEEKLEQLLQDLTESREKLEEMTASSVQLESSPMRSVSAMSDYDSSNVVALNKDYRSAMTLTHVSGVSGLSEPLDHVMEQAEVDEQGKNTEEKPHQVATDGGDSKRSEKEQLQVLQSQINALEAEIAQIKIQHQEEMENVWEEHKIALDELQQKKNAEYAEALQEEVQKHEAAQKELQQLHEEAVEALNDSHRKGMAKVRLQCASDTAAQVEEETKSIRDQLKQEFDGEMDSMKHRMELEKNEKLEEERENHEKALDAQAEKLSSSLEMRIAAVMEELHEQKQQALLKVSSEHQEEMNKIVEEMKLKINEITEREKESNERWTIDRAELERNMENVMKDLEISACKCKELNASLEDKEEQVKMTQDQQEDDLDKIRRKLHEEYETKQESALQKQALIFQQAQADFVKLHEEQLSHYTSVQKEEAELKENEIEEVIEHVRNKLMGEHKAEKEEMIATHSEELEVVAKKLVEVDEEKLRFEEEKNQLVIQLENLQKEKEQELAELKTNLVNQHMTKFQEVTASLDQLHKEEVDKSNQERDEKETRLCDELISLHEKIKTMEADQQDEAKEMDELLSQRFSQEELEERLQEANERHQTEVQSLQEEHELHLQQIKEEIETQNEEHKKSMQKILESQKKEMETLQKQFDGALNKTNEAYLLETQKMSQKIVELEAEIKVVEETKSQLETAKEREKELELMLEEYKIAREVLEEERKEEITTYEDKLEEFSATLDGAREEYKDLNTRIEFERAEYEAEIESVQDDVRTKEENIAELEAEAEHKTAALDSLQRQYKELLECRERETQENNNLLKLLRDDLDRLNNERDSSAGTNDQLLAALSELVRTNQRCEDLITRRLENLAIVGAEEQSQPQEDMPPPLSSHDDDTDATTTPLNTSLSGSFVDEGLDLSQRLAKSMFTGPEFDPAACEVVTGTGIRVRQATERLLDMLDNILKQLNVSQQAQTMLVDNLQKQIEINNNDDNETDGRDLQSQLQQAEGRISQLESIISEQNEAISKIDDASRNLSDKEDRLQKELAKLEEERALMQKQKNALTEGRDETELNLLRATEELANEKQMLIERHQRERDRLEEVAQQLEKAMEQMSKENEDKEVSFVAQIEDLNSQIGALRKQTASESRFAAELTTDREVERDQFEKEMQAMRNEINQARDDAKCESLLAEKTQSSSVSDSDSDDSKLIEKGYPVAAQHEELLSEVTSTKIILPTVSFLASKCRKLHREVEHLENDLDLKQQLHDETLKELEKLKKRIEEKEEIITELRDCLSQEELEKNKSEATSAKVELEESRRQQEVLQKELYSNMLRISALEAQLDRYRHGVDEDAIAALERVEAEERRLKEQGAEELEAKDSEIEHLVEQQNSLHNQIIEKEEQVEKLLGTMESLQEFESENISLKNKLVELETQLDSASAQAPSATQSEQFEALSHRLLEDKNAEIDELRQHLLQLRNGEENEDFHQVVTSLQTQVQELVSENEDLRTRLQETEEQLEGVQDQLVTIAPEDQLEAAKELPGESAGNTGIDEVDLTTHDLVHQDDEQKLHSLEKENACLRESLEQARKEAEDLISRVDVFNIPASTKEKIRDLEEFLEKEKDDRSSSDSSDDEEAEEHTDASSSASVNARDSVEKIEKTEKDSDGIQEKLALIEEELKSCSTSVLKRILCDKENLIRNRDDIILSLERDIDAKKGEVETLTTQLANVEDELKEPDVRIRMQGDEAMVGDEDAIKLEEKENVEDISLVESVSATEDHSTSTNHEEDQPDQEHAIDDDDDDLTEHSSSKASDSSSLSEASHHTSLSGSDNDPDEHDSKGEVDDCELPHDDDEDHRDGVEELKIILDSKEKEIEERDEIILQKEEVISQKERQLTEFSEACMELESRLKLKCCELEEELEEYKSSHPDDVLDYPAAQKEINEMKKQLEEAALQASNASEDCNRMTQQLDDIQRQCASLLDDNHQLEEQRKEMEEEREGRLSRLHDLETLLLKKEDELKQAQQNASELQNQTQEASDALQQLQTVAEEASNTRNMLQVELNRVTEECKNNRAQQLQLSTNITDNGSGDCITNNVKIHPSPALLHLHQEEAAVEVERLTGENEMLREQIHSLSFKIEELEIELETMKQKHIDECNLLVAQHTQEISKLKNESKLDSSQVDINVDQSSNLESALVDDNLERSTDVRPALSSTTSSTTDSESFTEEVVEELEDLKRNHAIEIEEIQERYTREMEEAVAMATEEQVKKNEEKVVELERKHRKEISDILSESVGGDNELAHRLNAELDLADKLDKELINQLTATNHSPVAVVEATTEGVTPDSALMSPAKDAEISTQLQHLLSRVHNEGVQVLSLSELQFLKQHQSHNSMSAADEEADNKPTVDIEGLKRAWESEKLALLDAIQALKDLLTQTANETAQSSDDDEGLKWRGELLRSVADLFERERRALLAELQASVVEARGEAEMKNELGAASRLEELERKIRSQHARQQMSLCTQVLDLAFTSELLRLRHEIRRLTSYLTCSTITDLKQQSELERLLTADRDQLVDDIKELKAERKEKLDQAHERIQQLQEQHKVAEETHRQAVSNLQNQLERVKSRLQQEEAFTADLRTSLDTEKQRSRSLLPALQSERERTLELSSEIAAITEQSEVEKKSAAQDAENLSSELSEAVKKVNELEEKVKNLEERRENVEEERSEERERELRLRERDQEAMLELKDTIEVEEKRRLEAVSAVEAERRNVALLHQELASERAASYNEIVRLKNKCDDLTSAVQAEHGRCEELRCALEQEATFTRHAREDLENQRKITAEARDNNRATVADLQAILEDAKKETERVQARVEVVEQEREEAIKRAGEEQHFLTRKLQDEKMSHDEASNRERLARCELQATLEAEKLRKQDAQRRVKELEVRQRDILQQMEKSPSPRDGQDALLASRRQLESLRQRLQLEASKLQNLVARTSHQPSPRIDASPSNSLLSSDGERIASLKRSLQDMQEALKDLYASLCLPERGNHRTSIPPIQFNDKLLEENAKLSEYAAEAAREADELRNEVVALKNNGRPTTSIATSAATDANQQKMASRMHKLYTRYLRAESFKKSLVYQKKYLLLLLGGFQDCEEATLALIARMGAYPSDDALRKAVTHRSPAFTRFRSAARVVMAVCRLKFLVKKWKRASSTVSSAIQSKHGVSMGPSLVNGAAPYSFTHQDRSISPYHHSTSRTPSPLYSDSNPRGVLPLSHDSVTSRNHYDRHSYEPPSHDTTADLSRYRHSTSPYRTSFVATSPTHRPSYEHDYSCRASNGESRGYLPTSSYAAMDRSNVSESDPSLNEYIRKLENLQHHLQYPK